MSQPKDSAVFPGLGNIVRYGYTIRPDKLEVVTTEVRITWRHFVYTTAIFPPETGSLVVQGREPYTPPRSPERTIYQFKILPPPPPLFVVSCDDKFEAGCQHERAVGWVAPPEPRAPQTSWEKLLLDDHPS